MDEPCTFYHEGRGWRYGVVRVLPKRGAKKAYARVEVAGKLIWTPRANVNPVGDYTYKSPPLN